MKVKCIKNTYEYGFVSKITKKINLTVGMVYNAEPIHSDRMSHVSLDDYRFLIYNDKGEWSTYRLHMFEPAE